jgi:integrase
MKPYKACSCRDPETGRLLGKKCPDREKRGHCKWYARYEAPRSADGKRRQPRIGPYDTEKDCKAALVAVLGQAGQTGHVDDRKVKVGDYLVKRLGWREAESEAGGGLKSSTLAAEREAIELYFKPGIGHERMVDLRDHHIRDMYAAMRLLNRPGEEEHPSELLRRLREARASRDGHRVSTRPLSEARIKRIHAVLTGALNDAVKGSKILGANPADGIFKTKGGGRKGRAKPLLWTAERVEHWEKTGRVPAKVMVWTATQAGAFLDFAEHDRLYPLLHFAGYWGMRRGELVGLEWPDVSLDRRRLHIRQAQADDELDDTKSEDSDRHIVFDEATATVGRTWRKAQLEERVAWGEAWEDSGRVFTYEDGRPLRPAYVSQRFELLVDRYNVLRQRRTAGWSVEKIARHHRTAEDVVRLALDGPSLPPVRFHDLRHGSATMLLAAGVPMKVVSDVLGHASSAFTSDVYAVVAEELAEDAATKISAFVPRRNRA